jgi:hypothetical protein
VLSQSCRDMGYTTDFYGKFTVAPTLKPEHQEYLAQFSETRRMKRDATGAAKLPDPVRIAAGLPIGRNGAYFVGSTGDFGQDHTPDVIDYNMGAEQPEVWCKWTPTEDGTAIEWNGVENFYEYVPWLEYLIEHFLGPWGYKLNGKVVWVGEEPGDTGEITVTDNVLEVGPLDLRSAIFRGLVPLR